MSLHNIQDKLSLFFKRATKKGKKEKNVPKTEIETKTEPRTCEVPNHDKKNQKIEVAIEDELPSEKHQNSIDTVEESVPPKEFPFSLSTIQK